MTPRRARTEESATPEIPRERLVSTVLGTPAGGMCQLVAPAGFGRRTLLRQALGTQATVVHLPPAPVDAAGWKPVLDRMDEAGADEWLVLLGADREWHAEALRRLDEASAPRQARIALATTRDLGSLLHRTRLAGRLVDIDADLLAFDPQESLGLLDLLGFPEATAAEAAGLCDGWAAALVLAARYGADHPTTHVPDWLRTQGADRLLGSWLDERPDEIRTMLLDTAFLDWLEPSLVDAVTDGALGGVLATLAEPRGPVRPARPPDLTGGPWFARSPLLTALLQHLATGRPGQPMRHHRAAHWHRAHDHLGPELGHLLAAGEADAARARFHTAERELLGSGLTPVFLQWYQSLPDHSLTAESLLRESWASALSGRLLEARRAHERLRTVLADSGAPLNATHPPVQNLEAEARVLEAWLAEYDGDVPRQVEAATQACALFGDTWSRSNGAQLGRLLLARGHLLLGQDEAAGEILSSVRASAFSLASTGEGRRSDCEAELAWQRGEVHEARMWASRHDRWLRAEDPQRVPTRFRRSVTGLLCLAEAGDVKAAVTGLQEITVTVLEGASLTDLVLAHLAAASALALRLRLRPALEHVAHASRAVLTTSPGGGLLPLVAAQEARLRLMAGDHVRAARALQLIPAGTTRQLLHARLMVLRSAPGALSLIREIDPRTPRELVEREVIAAAAYQRASSQRAEQHLLRAADTAAQHGMTSYLVAASEPLLELARRTAAYFVHDAMLEAIDLADAARPRSPSTPDLEPAASAFGGPFTRGELQLLALLPSRLSYQGIAEHLGVSVNTVKTRMRRLYAKLDAHSRDDAVEKATSMGLIAGTA